VQTYPLCKCVFIHAQKLKSMYRNYASMSLLSFNFLHEVGSFLYFKVRVRCRRKKLSFAVSSPDEFLVVIIVIVICVN